MKLRRAFLFLFHGTLFFLVSVSLFAHELVEEQPYLPQKWEIGVGLGSGWSSSSYFLGEALAGVRVMNCGSYLFCYIDGSERVLAQKGQTNYLTTVGWRFQKYFDGSRFGPFVKAFAGYNHYLFSGVIQDTGLFGISAGGYMFLHPGADLRLEVSQAFGPIRWTLLSIGFVFKLQNF